MFVPFFLCILVPEASTLSSPGQAVESITIGRMRKPSLSRLPFFHPCSLSSSGQYLLLNKMQHSIKTQNTEIMSCKNLPGAKCVLLKRSTGGWSLHLLLSNEKEGKESSTATRRVFYFYFETTCIFSIESTFPFCQVLLFFSVIFLSFSVMFLLPCFCF